jgi:hypothetical protein
MGVMGNYCKAYLVKDLRAFGDWREDLSALRPEEEGGDDRAAIDRVRDSLGDDDVLYLQEDLVVTDGIFKDEHIVFASASEEWRRFCAEQLEFSIPSWVSEQTKEAPAGTTPDTEPVPATAGAPAAER